MLNVLDKLALRTAIVLFLISGSTFADSANHKLGLFFSTCDGQYCVQVSVNPLDDGEYYMSYNIRDNSTRDIVALGNGTIPHDSLQGSAYGTLKMHVNTTGLVNFYIIRGDSGIFDVGLTNNNVRSDTVNGVRIMEMNQQRTIISGTTTEQLADVSGTVLGVPVSGTGSTSQITKSSHVVIHKTNQ